MDERLQLAFQLLLSNLTEALQQAGNDALHDVENQTAQMSEDQALDFIKDKMENPFRFAKKYIEQLERRYDEFKKDPAVIQITAQNVAELFGMDVEEVKKLTEDAGKSDDDDTTKH